MCIVVQKFLNNCIIYTCVLQNRISFSFFFTIFKFTPAMPGKMPTFLRLSGPGVYIFLIQ